LTADASPAPRRVIRNTDVDRGSLHHSSNINTPSSAPA
jgi:hypothetical protein